MNYGWRNEHENTTTPKLWNTVKAVLRGRFIAIQAYLKKQVQFSRYVMFNSLQPREYPIRIPNLYGSCHVYFIYII